MSALLVTASLICTRIPLLNYLGFEFSLFNAIVAGFLVGLLTVLLWNADPPRSASAYWSFVRSILLLAGSIVSLPLVVNSVNAFFVKNCSFSQGFRL
ncbi:MAG TPA: hypothetical protein VMM37_09585, partial [Bacteroidota bacterium]|nr:hypothetical protein [Bacteroidota bacterium]